jgi:hypothetical protein
MKASTVRLLTISSPSAAPVLDSLPGGTGPPITGNACLVMQERTLSIAAATARDPRDIASGFNRMHPLERSSAPMVGVEPAKDDGHLNRCPSQNSNTHNLSVSRVLPPVVAFAAAEQLIPDT